MKTIEDIFDLLLDGTKRQMDELVGCGASYQYSPGCGAFTVSLAGDEIRAHKIYDPPDCVRFFGVEHTL
ncbi:MAG: hypothetical protein RR572_03070 [Raoultibacter sp.]